MVLAHGAAEHAVHDDAFARPDEATEVVLREELEALRLLAALHRLGRLLDLELLGVHEERRGALPGAHDELERGLAPASALILVAFERLLHHEVLLLSLADEDPAASALEDRLVELGAHFRRFLHEAFHAHHAAQVLGAQVAHVDARRLGEVDDAHVEARARLARAGGGKGGEVDELERLLGRCDRLDGVPEQVLREVRVVLVDLEPVDLERTALGPAQRGLVGLLLVVFLEEALPALEPRLVADGSVGMERRALDFGRRGHRDRRVARSRSGRRTCAGQP